MDERTKYGHPPSAELPSLPGKIPFTCLFARLRRFATSTSSDCAYRVNNAQREHAYAERTIGNLRVRSQEGGAQRINSNLLLFGNESCRDYKDANTDGQ